MSVLLEMKMYIGVKSVGATEMNLGNYNKYRGWDIPENEDPSTEGYLVVYSDGYKSWCPKKQFEEANRLIESMTFGHAVEVMKRGEKVARIGWNGKNQWVVMMPPLYLPPFNSQEPGAKVNDRTAKHIGEDTPLDSQAYFALFNAQGKWQPGWVPSTSDVLAEDWRIVY